MFWRDYAYLEHCWSCYGNVTIWQCGLLRRKMKATIDTYSGPTDTSQILWTASGWSVHSSEETLFLNNMSAPWFILPTQEGCSPACRVASRRGRPGDLCMTPRTCCPSILAHGVPECLAGRIDRPDTLLAFLGSWCAGPTPLRTTGRRSVYPRTALPNPC